MGDITALVLQGGAEPDLDAVFQRVEPEFRRFALARLASSRDATTLSATALVNEACPRRVQSARLSVGNRRHFCVCVGRAMRQIVVDCTRARIWISKALEQ